MIYFKSVLVGIGTMLLGCLVMPVAMMLWWFGKANNLAANKAETGPGEGLAVSFSPMGLGSHLAHSLGFWVFVVVLFCAGFLIALRFQKKQGDGAQNASRICDG